MSDIPFNAYDLLNVDPTASTLDIKKAFKLMAQEHHPDKHQNLKTATILFKILVQARDTLLDPERRLAYDYAHGIKEKPKAKSDTIFRNTSEPKTDWGSLMIAGVAGLAIGAIWFRKSTKKKG